MSQGIEALTLTALSVALDAAAVRQEVLASNVANASVPGYVPKRVSFDTEWQRQGEAYVPMVRAHTEPVVGLNVDGAVRLDQEMAAMAQNSAHYTTLVRAMNKHLAVLNAAVTEGKR
jgi:flagellar basal-body rod protein FlgB